MRSNVRCSLFVAAVFHILFTTLIYIIGVREFVPEMVDSRGIGEFASDGVKYMRQIASLVDNIRKSNIGAVFTSGSSFHVKLYSISFVLLEPLFGFTILSAELLNLFSYLSILWLVFTICKEIFNPKVGIYSMVIIGLWPSFLLYSTQLYKTPSFLVVFFVLILSLVHFITPEKNKSKSILSPFLFSLIAIVVLWFLRNDWWYLFVVLILLELIFLAVRMVLDRKVLFWHLIASAFLLFASFFIQQYATDFIISLTAAKSPTNEPANLRASSADILPLRVSFGGSTRPAKRLKRLLSGYFQSENNYYKSGFVSCFFEKLKLWADTFAQIIGQERQDYVHNKKSGSSIDRNYIIKNFGDLVRYLPRALAIGLFAPFPNMWFASGAKLGLSARLLSGLETMLLYGIFPFSILGIWHTRRNLSTWYLVVVVFVSVIALGTIVVNIGALYRFRYAFWMITIVFGVGGYNQVALPYLRSFLDKRRQK